MVVVGGGGGGGADQVMLFFPLCRFSCVYDRARESLKNTLLTFLGRFLHSKLIGFLYF